MKEKILEQAGKELKVAAWIDLLIMIVGVGVTLHLFAMSAVTAGMSVGSITDELTSGLGGLLKPQAEFNVIPFIIMVVTLAALVVINWFGIRMLLKNKAQRAKLNEGLARLYKDEAVDQYTDGSIYKSYENRYNLFAVVLGSIGALSVIVTLVIFINQLTNL